MTRKEQLIELGKRCESGDLKKDMNFRLLFADCVPARYYGLFANACNSLDAVAKLEAELLHEGFMLRVYNEGPKYVKGHKEWWTVRLINPDGTQPVYAGSATEPLARLAALCYALAELEGW